MIIDYLSGLVFTVRTMYAKLEVCMIVCHRISSAREALRVFHCLAERRRRLLQAPPALVTRAIVGSRGMVCL